MIVNRVPLSISARRRNATKVDSQPVPQAPERGLRAGGGGCAPGNAHICGPAAEVLLVSPRQTHRYVRVP